MPPAKKSFKRIPHRCDGYVLMRKSGRAEGRFTTKKSMADRAAEILYQARKGTILHGFAVFNKFNNAKVLVLTAEKIDHNDYKVWVLYTQARLPQTVLAQYGLNDKQNTGYYEE